MAARTSRFRILPILIAWLLVLSGSVSSIDKQTKYPQTISVLQTAYQLEITTVRSYVAYSEKALSEDYPNIGYLFATFAASESIHARNFKQLLIDLGAEVKEPQESIIPVLSTRRNLGRAVDRELEDIDINYPRFIEQIEPEGHKASLLVFRHTLESEKQHRDLIEKIGSGTGIFFELLTKKIESKVTSYYVCKICGALASNLLKDACPICHTAGSYREVQKVTQEKIEKGPSFSNIVFCLWQ